MALSFKLNPLCGIFPPMVTPLLEQNKLDVEGLHKLVKYILSGKVHGIFILGTTGEAPSLSYELRRELIKRTCLEVGNRVPVLVGITDTSYSESVSIACYAAECGASAVVLAPPYYFPAGQPEILEYLTHITKQIPLPMFLYNIPSHTKIIFDADTVFKAANIPGIVGLKDSSGSMMYFHKLKYLFKERKDFSFLVGPEELLAESLIFGANGGISGGANIFPRLYVDLYNAAINKDMLKIISLHQKIIQISSTLYSVGHFSSSFLKGVKCVLSWKGICSDYMAEPFHSFNTKERTRIKALLEEIDLN
jgi:4-hydroxy-tetrahydrodipicolinate synthase